MASDGHSDLVIDLYRLLPHIAISCVDIDHNVGPFQPGRPLRPSYRARSGGAIHTKAYPRSGRNGGGVVS